ncbi:MAG: hypothetical protein RIS70_3996 [Planctomycetota bacterium]|jgi:uncharacterized protein (UPF0548 family)
MLSFAKPTTETIQRFLDAEGRRQFTYDAVGATASAPPAGYMVDHTRVRLGEGQAVFEAACDALRKWRQFDLGWLEVWPADEQFESEKLVAIVARAIGCWWLNACRIVYTINESGPVSRFGFAYGTLPDHAGTGEERFLIEWTRADDTVWYDILAFSRPQKLLTRIGYPYMRRTQKRFGRESAASMKRAVLEAASSPANQVR